MELRYMSITKMRRKVDQLERKLSRLADPKKVSETLREIAMLEEEIDYRIKVHPASITRVRGE